jgi:hypothetical protein
MVTVQKTTLQCQKSGKASHCQKIKLTIEANPMGRHQDRYNMYQQFKHQVQNIPTTALVNVINENQNDIHHEP